MAMSVFYRDRSVRIGSDALHVADQVYPLEDLELVWHRRGSRGPAGAAVIATPVLLIVALIGCLAVGVVLIRRVPFAQYNGAVVLAGALVTVVLLGVLGMFAVDGLLSLVERSYRHGSVELQIWARYHGRDVLLFATRDRMRFGKVYRALQRAVEYSTG
jgi:hypothetical protein